MAEAINEGVGHAKSKKLWVVFVLLVIAAIVILWYVKDSKEKAIAREKAIKLNNLIAQVPQEVLFKDIGQNVEIYKVEKTDDFTLNSNESLPEEGITYTVNKEQKMVRKDIFNQANQQNWVFSFGTKDVKDGIIYKFTDGKKYYFVKLAGGTEQEADGSFKTQVNIVSVNK
jgi:hypothetical protein